MIAYSPTVVVCYQLIVLFRRKRSLLVGDALINYSLPNYLGSQVTFTCSHKPGVSYGATDEFGRKSVEKVTNVWEFYATVLHILGLNYDELKFYYNGLDRKLTDVHCRVIREVLA